MKKRNAIALIIVMIIIFIILAYFYIKNLGNKELTISTIEETLPDKIKDCNDNIKCITNLAIENKNESICYRLTSYENGMLCQLEFLIAEGNLSNCGNSKYYTTCKEAILNKTNN